MAYFGGNTLAFSILKLLVKSIFVLAKDDERSDSNLRVITIYLNYITFSNLSSAF